MEIKFNRNIVVAICAVLALAVVGVIMFVINRNDESSADNKVKTESVRKERRAIMAGNKEYHSQRYADAIKQYENALTYNASSPVAIFNLGLSALQIASSKADSVTVQKNSQRGTQLMQSIAAMASTRPGIASAANYNLGNFAFNSEDYSGAINFYKQALRLNPEDNDARRNLRIAQLKQQNNDQNQDKQQNQQQEQQEEQNNKDENQNNNDNSDQNQDKQQNQQPPKENEIDSQAANQILQAIENKENQTRARMNQMGMGNEKNKESGRGSTKNW